MSICHSSVGSGKIMQSAQNPRQPTHPLFWGEYFPPCIWIELFLQITFFWHMLYIYFKFLKKQWGGLTGTFCFAVYFGHRERQVHIFGRETRPALSATPSGTTIDYSFLHRQDPIRASSVWGTSQCLFCVSQKRPPPPLCVRWRAHVSSMMLCKYRCLSNVICALSVSMGFIVALSVLIKFYRGCT